MKRSFILPVVFASSLGLAACSEDSAGPETGPAVEDVRTAVTVEADEFFADENRFVGQTVTLSAEVSDVISPQAFTIAGEGGPEPVLVVTTAGLIPPTLSDNAVVQVTGTVRPYDLAALGTEVGADFDDALFDEAVLEDHALVAFLVTVTDPTEN